jgi:hypothetical protein
LGLKKKKKEAPAGGLRQTLRRPVPTAGAVLGGTRSIISETPGCLFMFSLCVRNTTQTPCMTVTSRKSMCASNRASCVRISNKCICPALRFHIRVRVSIEPCAHLKQKHNRKTGRSEIGKHMGGADLLQASRSPAPLRDPIPSSASSCRPRRPALNGMAAGRDMSAGSSSGLFCHQQWERAELSRRGCMCCRWRV